MVNSILTSVIVRSHFKTDSSRHQITGDEGEDAIAPYFIHWQSDRTSKLGHLVSK
jgi:hypothetical protein